jgi:hypothetical protein
MKMWLTFLLAFALLIAGCGKSPSSPTAPSTVEPTQPSTTWTNVATFQVANGVFYSAGSATQAVFTKTTGVVEVKTAGNAWDVSLRWTPLAIEASKVYRVSFTCTSAPTGRSVQVELKRADGAASYGIVNAICSGEVSAVITATGSDPAGRVSINFGAATGAYTMGPVTIERGST